MSLFADYNFPFAVALAIMGIVLILQIIGVGDLLGSVDAEIDLDLDADLDGDLHADGALDGLLSVLGFGRVPFMVWLISFLLVFAGIGVGVQGFAHSLTGGPLFTWLAALIAGGAAVPVNAVLVRPIGAILPKDETTAVGIGSLLGRRGEITTGTARRGSPARTRVKDIHGHTHHVMVEPHSDTGVFQEGETVLLVRRESGLFFAKSLENRQLSPD